MRKKSIRNGSKKKESPLDRNIRMMLLVSEVTLKRLANDIYIKGSFATENDEKDLAEKRRNLNDLKTNEWAWFTAKVQVKCFGIQEKKYVGGCSYLSEEDFRKSDMFKSMVNECVRRIHSQIQLFLNSIKRAKITRISSWPKES